MEIIISFALGMVAAGMAYLAVVLPENKNAWRRGYMAGYFDALNREEGKTDNATDII